MKYIVLTFSLLICACTNEEKYDIRICNGKFYFKHTNEIIQIESSVDKLNNNYANIKRNMAYFDSIYSDPENYADSLSMETCDNTKSEELIASILVTDNYYQKIQLNQMNLPLYKYHVDDMEKPDTMVMYNKKVFISDKQIDVCIRRTMEIANKVSYEYLCKGDNEFIEKCFIPMFSENILERKSVKNESSKSTIQRLISYTTEMVQDSVWAACMLKYDFRRYVEEMPYRDYDGIVLKRGLQVKDLSTKIFAAKNIFDSLSIDRIGFRAFKLGIW